MKIENNKGPRIEPWGSPELASLRVDDSPLRTTLCFLQKDNQRSRRGPGTSLDIFYPRSQEHCKEVIEEFHCDLLVLNAICGQN